MDWCRLWHDAPDDPKWRLIARKAKCRSGDVWAVWCRMLVCASKHEPRGVILGWDDETEAVALDCDTETVTAIREAMQGRVLNGYALAGWERRNPKREDNSADRVRAYRERQVAGSSVTGDDVTQCNAAKRTVTLDKIRLDKKERTPSLSPKGDGVSFDFDVWWEQAPRKVGRGQAMKAYSAARKRADAETLLAGIQRYAASCRAKGTEPQFIAHPATWLNGDRWLDEDAPPKPTASAAAPRIETYDDREAREAKRLAEGVAALKAGRPPPVGWSKIDTSRAFSRGLIDTVQAERAGLPISIRTPAQQAGAE